MTSTSTTFGFGQFIFRTSLLFTILVSRVANIGADDLKSGPDNPDQAGHFRGQVLGPDGKPFAGAKICVMPLSKDLSGKLATAEEIGPRKVRATTGADGRFDIHAPEVTLTDLDGLPTNRLCLVVATAEGYGPDWVHVAGRKLASRNRRPPLATDLKLQLVADVALNGQLAGPDGRPLADAHVQVTNIMIPQEHDLDAHIQRGLEHRRAQQKSGQIPSFSTPSYEKFLSYPQVLPNSTTVQTDAQGRFVLSGLGTDRLVQLKVSGPTIVDSYIGAVTRVMPGQKSRGQYPDEYIEYLRKNGARFTRQLEPGRTLSGVVLDARTRRPISGMLVGIGHEGYPRDGIRGHRTTTDAEGRFNVTGLDPHVQYRAITAMSPPGMTYQSASVTVRDDAPVEIECEPGIPFRLTLTDEQGQPVDAEVNYFEVRPNPYAPKLYCFPSHNPISQTKKNPTGTYAGFALPGPGVVLVKTPADFNYLPPTVDPWTFFAGGKPAPIPKKSFEDYGNRDTINTVMGMVRQNYYAAIVLVNPTPDSPPLELRATVKKGTPRQVTLIDPEGNPIIGVKADGVMDYGREPPLRTAMFPLFRLHPERDRRIIFQHEDRKLTGYLVARGDGDSPYTVTLQPWASIKGRLVDEIGDPLPLNQKGTIWEKALHIKASLPDDPYYRHAQYAEVNRTGRFMLDKLIPGELYDGLIYQNQGKFRYAAFADLVLKPGEVRDLGEIRLTVHTLADARTQSKGLSPVTRENLRQPLTVARFGGLTHDAPAACLPLVARVAIDSR